MEQLRRGFEWAKGEYKISGDLPPSHNLKRVPAATVVVHGLRSVLRSLDMDEVVQTMAPHLGEAPRLLRNRAALIPVLGLSPRELRFVEHVIDGVTAASDILARGGIGKETAIQILFVMQLFAMLEWHPAEHVGGETLADRLNARAEKIDRFDHFEALGVHWSVSRADLDRAYRELRETLGPGSCGQRAAPAAAAKILARAEIAYQVVSVDSTRRDYLLEIHPDVDYESIESIAESHAEWDEWRGARADTVESVRLKDELLELSRMQHRSPKTD